MNNHQVLVTGQTFITSNHEQCLLDHGVGLTRLENATASDDELIAALSGMDGYILGGLERVTDKVIRGAATLRAISFTGAGWTEFIPGHASATKRGIAITAAPGANAQAVAELTIGLMHERLRNISYLSGSGAGERIRSRQFRGLTVGIVGAGNIGTKVGRILNGMYGTKVLYSSPRRNLDFEFATGAERTSIDHLVESSDIVSLHMRKTAETTRMFDAALLSRMQDDSILINTSFADAIDPTSLFDAVSSGRITAALDVQFSHLEEALPDFKSVSSRHLLQMGVQSGFATYETVQIASDIATQAMIDLLSGATDPPSLVNPEYKSYR